MSDEKELTFEESLHRTWVQYLSDHGYKEVAAIVLDGEIHIGFEEIESYDSIHDIQYTISSPECIFIDLPSDTFEIVMRDNSLQEIISKSFNRISDGHILDSDNNTVREFKIQFRVKLLKIDEEWKERVRFLITESREANQGVVTEKVFARRKRQPFLYNEMKFASKSEMAIARALEEKRVLFFPLPLAVRSDIGALHRDHREPDFLICDDGVWGILEVSFHPYRFEKDAEKDVWFKQSGILCIQHVSAERCYQTPEEVVDEFLTILAKHKRS